MSGKIGKNDFVHLYVAVPNRYFQDRRTGKVSSLGIFKAIWKLPFFQESSLYFLHCVCTHRLQTKN
ncbi:hypothetical protein C0J52_01435 [Blattella germanica]|nr:hypothetical protein C0J52_01435 [Blattella germanica]